MITIVVSAHFNGWYYQEEFIIESSWYNNASQVMIQHQYNPCHLSSSHGDEDNMSIFKKGVIL